MNTAPAQEPPDLGSQTTNTPLGTKIVPPTDPNLQPTTVNLPQNQVDPALANQAQPTTLQATPVPTTVSSPIQPPPIAAQTISTLIPPAEQSQVFINPNPPSVPDNIVTAANPLGVDSRISDSIGYADQPPPKKFNIPKLPFNPRILFVILLLLLLLGGSGFAVNEFYFNRISSLSLVSENSQYYLTLAVKKNPQSEKAKVLVKKFPGGERLLKQFDKYYTQYISVDPDKDPLLDLTQYANSELLFARISRSEDPEDYSRGLFSIMDAESIKESKEAIDNFKDDKGTYKTVESKEKDNTVLELTLQSEKKRYEQELEQSQSFRSALISSAKPKKLYVTNIKNFLVSSDEKDDVKSAINLADSKNILGFKGSDQPKSILDSADHQKLEKFFPKENFLRFFQRDPLTPYNAGLPFYTSSVDTYAGSPASEAKTFQKITRAVTVEAQDSDAVVQSMQVDFLK